MSQNKIDRWPAPIPEGAYYKHWNLKAQDNQVPSVPPKRAEEKKKYVDILHGRELWLVEFDFSEFTRILVLAPSREEAKDVGREVIMDHMQHAIGTCDGLADPIATRVRAPGDVPVIYDPGERPFADGEFPGTPPTIDEALDARP